MNPGYTPRNTRRININEPNDKSTDLKHEVKTNTANAKQPIKKRHIKYGNDDIVFPVSDKGDCTAYDAIVKPHGMSGTEKFFSVPKNTDDTACALHKYLENLCGTNICAALWTNGRNKIEKCGILTEVGKDYITLKEKNRLVIITMDKIKYISVFCV